MKNISEKSQESGKILGINVNGTELAEVLARVEHSISHNSKLCIVTPNPELILMAQDNKELKNALNSADIAIPDGVGLKIANPNLNIIKGREFFMELIKLSDKNHWKVFLLGGLADEAQTSMQVLQKTYKGIKIQAAKGPILDIKASPVSEVDSRRQKDIIDKINDFCPDILFVAFGNPKQEIWIHKNFPGLKIKAAMSVGGTFRYLAGTSKLPPAWMSKLGLEWLWRLLTEPKRIFRVFNAVIVFPVRYLLYRLSR